MTWGNLAAAWCGVAGLVLLASTGQAQDTRRDLGCITQAEVEAGHTPPELAYAVRACIEAERLEDAMQVYYTYSSFTLFDQQRVRDESAHVVLQDLSPWIFTGWSFDRMNALKAVANRLRDRESEFFLETCARIRTIGWPDYRPGYMIRHGIWPRKHAEDWGHPDFDAKAAWEKAVSEINHCPPAD